LKILGKKMHVPHTSNFLSNSTEMVNGVATFQIFDRYVHYKFLNIRGQITNLVKLWEGKV
jgi:hypothetical protein